MTQFSFRMRFADSLVFSPKSLPQPSFQPLHFASPKAQQMSNSLTPRYSAANSHTSLVSGARPHARVPLRSQRAVAAVHDARGPQQQQGLRAPAHPYVGLRAPHDQGGLPYTPVPLSSLCVCGPPCQPLRLSLFPPPSPYFPPLSPWSTVSSPFSLMCADRHVFFACYLSADQLYCFECQFVPCLISEQVCCLKPLWRFVFTCFWGKNAPKLLCIQYVVFSPSSVQRQSFGSAI